MLLAEALAERAEAQARLHALEERLGQSILVQEGDPTDEDPATLLEEAERVSRRISQLATAINETNSQTPFPGFANLSAALSERDHLLRQRRLVAGLANSAGARNTRYARTEIRILPALPVSQLRSTADELSKRYRELDTKIQQVNWSTQLVGRLNG